MGDVFSGRVLILLFFGLFSSFFRRTHKRYYYTNGVTGDSQWEFPSEEFGGEMEIDTAIEEATPSTQVAEPIGTDEQANVPVWSYPGEI